MLAFTVRRLLAVPFVLFFVSLIILALMQFLSPEQRAANYLSEQQAARSGAVQEVIERYGFNRSFPEQYGLWLAGILRGDLGYSEVAKQPVLATMRDRLPASAELTLFSIIPVIGLAIWLGTQAALRRNTVFDQLTRILAIVGWSLPTFVFAIWLLVIFFGGLGWFGVGRIRLDFLTEIARGTIETPTGFMTVDALLNGRFDMFVDALLRLVLPVTTLVVVLGAQIMRVMRSSLY